MRVASKVLVGITVVLAVAVAVAGLRFAAAPPRPSLPLPTGQVLAGVRGNCSSGNEILGCTSGGPRSFLTVTAPGDPRRAGDELFARLLASGWSKQQGATARDYASAGEPEDLQPVYCHPGQGCVGLFRLTSRAYVLAWFEGR